MAAREAQIGALGFDLIGYAENLTRDVDRAMRAVESRMKLASRRMTSIGTKLSAAITAPLAAVAGVSLKAFADQQKAETAMRSALQSTGQEVEKNFARMQQMASGIQKVTTVGDEMALEMAAIATNMGIMAPQMDGVIKGAIGLSRAFGMDMQTAVKAAAAAVQGKTDLLTRYIPTLSQIEDPAKRVAFVVEKMGQGFEQAKDEANTFWGKLAQLKNTFGDLLEQIGEHFAPAIEKAIVWMEQAIQVVQKLDPAMVRMGVAIATAAALAGPLVTVVGLAVGGLASLAGVIATMGWPVLLAGVGAAVGAFFLFKEEIEGATSGTQTMGETLEAFGDKAVKIIGWVADAITKVRAVLKTWQSGLEFAIGGVVKLGEFGAEAFDVLRVGVSKFGNVFVEVFNSVATLAEDVFNGITKKMAETFNSLTGWYNDLPAPLKGVAGLAGLELPTLTPGQIKIPRLDHSFDTARRDNPLGGVADGIFEEAGRTFEEAVELYGEKPSEKIIASWDRIKDSIKGAVESIGKDTKKGGTDIDDLFKDIEVGAGSAAAKAGETAKAITEQTADQVDKIGNDAVTEIDHIGDRMKHTLSDGIHSALKGDFELKEFGLRILDNWQRQVADDLSKAMVDTFRKAMGDVPGITGDAMNQSNRIAAASGQDFQNIWSDSIGSVANMFSRWLSAMGDAVARLGRWIWNSLSSVFSSFGVSAGGGGGSSGSNGYPIATAAIGLIGSFFGGSHAMGGRPALGKISLVGERGPELFVPDTAGTILPNHQLAGMAGGGGGGITINIEQHFQAGVSEAMLAEAADEIHASTMEAVTEGVARGGGFRAAMKR